MNTSKWLLRACLCLGVLQVVSCTKNIDKISDDAISIETANDATAVNEFSNCKLRRIYHYYSASPNNEVSGLFTYNAAGNPVSLTYPGGGTGNQNYYFFYDKKNRLIEWRQSYNPDGDFVEATTHKYGYDNNNVLVVDSAFHFAQYSEDGFEGWGDTTILLITYDTQGRVVKESARSVKGGPTRYPTYTYDARGNLGVSGWKSSSYDNKVSIFRSHPIFQFIFRNYSKNNAAVQAKYNSKGLPLSANPLNDQFFNAYSTAYGSEYGVTKAIYDCP